MSDDLIETYGVSKKLMPLVHLPVQSGSDKVLELMNRKHTIEEYFNIYQKLKEKNPLIKFSSDFIIGYPGESEKDFHASLDLIKEIKFINSYSFIFSPRPGTAASKLKLIDRKITQNRLEIIQEQLFNQQIEMNKSLENSTIDVLVENKTTEGNKFFGRSDYMTPVIFNGNDEDVGKVIKVKINKSNQNTLFGEIIRNTKLKVA